MRARRAFPALVAAGVLGLAFVLAVPPTAYDGPPAYIQNPVEHVDTLIGTGTGGETVGEINNFPGPTVPFGMVQYSPDTVGNYAGYNHGNTRATGFSMSHASVGCAAFGDISALPTTRLGSTPWDWSEEIAHDKTETGVPGYYRVRFPETRVTAELTATTRTGLGRFTYPHDGRPALLYVRSGASLAGNDAATLQIGTDNTTITGSATTGGFCGMNNRYTVYFAMRFNQPFTTYGTWDGYSVTSASRSVDSRYSGAYVAFPAGTVLEVRTALSYVSVDGARSNLAAESTAGFDATRAAASARWNSALSRIAVAGRNRANVTTFYTALYRCLLHPNTFDDADGRYVGFDGEIHVLTGGRTQYANFSDWDTYRSLAPLQALLFPKEAGDMAQSLVNDAEQSGSLPRWALANAATGEMSGDSVVPLIANLYAYGGKGFDLRTALRYMVNGATQGGIGRNGYVERPGIATYQALRYAPQPPGGRFPGASITLEWAVDDFAISRFADALGESAVSTEFQRRAQYWQSLFNPSTRYISPRGPSGLFPDGPGFVAYQSMFGQDGYDEGNAEQYLWWVPQNIAGLVTALGGREAVATRLDRFVSRLNVGPNEPYLWAGNEPGFGVPWLYNYLGQPWKTQETVDRIRGGLYGPTADGEPGNDDLGALSSWFVWAALGLYPGTPGSAMLTLAAPLFDRAVVALPENKSIRISAPGASGPNRLRYIDRLDVDHRATDQTYLPASVISTGGDVEFMLAAHPNRSWATAKSAAPPSYGAGSSAVTINVPLPIFAVAPGGTGTVTVDAQRMIEGTGDYTITGAADTPGITVAPVSGPFAVDGSAAARIAISVAGAVPAGYYPIYLTTAVDSTECTAVVLAIVGGEP